MIRAILTDIEGTTSSISFVKDVLFPYAAKHLPEFLAQHWREDIIQAQCQTITKLTGQEIYSAEQANAILQDWIKEDKKITPLKVLQGMIWEAGYQSGDYRAHLYPDVVPQLQNWKRLGLKLYVYSSGSIAAQKLFFEHSEAGNIRHLFSGFFDTTSGAKKDSASYQRIAENIAPGNIAPGNTALKSTGLAAKEILFLSDIDQELDAARAAGMSVTLLDRQHQSVAQQPYPVTDSFSDIHPENY